MSDTLPLELLLEEQSEYEFICYIKNNSAERVKFLLDDRFKFEITDSSGNIINPTSTIAKKVPRGTKIKTFYKINLNPTEKKEVKKLSFAQSIDGYVTAWKKGLYYYKYGDIAKGIYKIKLTSNYINVKNIDLEDINKFPKESIKVISGEFEIDLK